LGGGCRLKDAIGLAHEIVGHEGVADGMGMLAERL
jgi:hypothetical protein